MAAGSDAAPTAAAAPAPVSIATITLKDLFNAAEKKSSGTASGRDGNQTKSHSAGPGPARSDRDRRRPPADPYHGRPHHPDAARQALGVSAHLPPEEAAKAARSQMRERRRQAAKQSVPVGLPVPSAATSTGGPSAAGPPPLPSEYAEVEAGSRGAVRGSLQAGSRGPNATHATPVVSMRLMSPGQPA